MGDLFGSDGVGYDEKLTFEVCVDEMVRCGSMSLWKKYMPVSHNTAQVNGWMEALTTLAKGGSVRLSESADGKSQEDGQVASVVIFKAAKDKRVKKSAAYRNKKLLQESQRRDGKKDQGKPTKKAQTSGAKGKVGTTGAANEHSSRELAKVIALPSRVIA